MGRRRFTLNRRAIGFVKGGYFRLFLVVGLAFFLAFSFFSRHAMAINIVMNFKSGHDSPSFDPDGSRLIALMGSVESYYQDIFEESGHTLTVEFYYDNLDGGTLAVHNNIDTDAFWPWDDGKPTKCRIRFDSGRNWFIDDTPLDNSEFNMQQTLYRDLSSTDKDAGFNGNVPDLMEVTYNGKAFSSAPSEARNYTDMWTVALHEMGHGLGMTGNCASEDVDDGEYDFTDVLTWGYSVEANCYASDNKYHLKADTLMDPYTSSGWRHLPSMVDILAMEDAGEWKADYIDLPRQDFYSSSATADFNTRTNWSGNQVPGSGDETHIRHGRTATLSANHTVASLGVESNSTVGVGSYMLTVYGDTLVGSSSLQTGTISIGSGELNTYDVTVNSGSLVSLGGGTLKCDTGLLNYNGTLAGSGTIQAEGFFQVRGNLHVNGGTLTINGETLTFTRTSQTQVNGSLKFSANTTIMTGATFSGTGELVTNSGAPITCQKNTVIDVSMNIADQFNLDENIGELTVNADVTLETTAELHMDLGFNSNQIVSDHLIVAGETDLGNATLVLSLLGDFVPIIGDQFDLFDWGTTITGAFADIIAPEGYAFGFGDLYTDGLITVLQSPHALPGDANEDGRVDGSDVTILANNWQYGVNPGTPKNATWKMGDFNRDRQVDGSDLTILANNWQAGVSSAAANVPEPSTVAILLTLVFSALSIATLKRRLKSE